MKEGGWSVLELICCVAIMLTVFTAAVPAITYQDKFAVQYETYKILNELRYLQLVSHNYDYSQDYMDGEKMQKPAFSVDTVQYFIYRGNKLLYLRQIPANLKISCNRKKISFYVNGSSTAGTIKIKGKSYGQAIVIDIVGRMRVEEI